VRVSAMAGNDDENGKKENPQEMALGRRRAENVPGGEN